MRPKSVLAYRRKSPLERIRDNQPQNQRVETSGHKTGGPGGKAPGALSSGFLRGELSSEVQHFSRGGKSEALSGSVIEHIHDLGNFLLGHLLEVGASREKLTYQAIQVLYRRLLPRGMGTREIEGDPQGFLHFLITGKFFSPIPGHGFQWELPVLKQEPKSPHGLLGRAAS